MEKSLRSFTGVKQDSKGYLDNFFQTQILKISKGGNLKGGRFSKRKGENPTFQDKSGIEKNKNGDF